VYATKSLRIATHYQAAECNFSGIQNVLSETERITLLMIQRYVDLVRFFEQVAILFNTTYSDREPISKYRKRFESFKRFEETGLVKDRQRRPKLATNVDKSLEVMQTFVKNQL